MVFVGSDVQIILLKITFAYGPAVPLPFHYLFLYYNPELFTFLVPAYPGCPAGDVVCFLLLSLDCRAPAVRVCRRCSKELNQWEMLTEYGSAKGNTNSHLVLESAWRQQNYWAVVKDAVSQVT